MSNKGMMTRRSLLVGGAVSTCFAGAATYTASESFISDVTPKFDNISDHERPPAAQTGVVVFTGETDRIRRGLELYMDGKADHLLISGTVLTGDKAQLQRFCKNLGISVKRPLDGIEVDTISRNTRDNGDNSAAWLTSKGLTHGVLVTSDYHMERSLIHLSRALRDDNVKVIQHPVVSRADTFTRVAERGKVAMARFGFSSPGSQF